MPNIRTTAAAFYDLDGTLVSTNLVHALVFSARHGQGLFRSARQTAAAVAGIPLFFATDLYSRKLFNDLFFRWYRGVSEDRLRFLAGDLFERVLRPSLFPGTLDLIASSRRSGLRQVVVTGALDLTIEPLMRYLGVDTWVANRLEFVDGVSTGRLVPPIMAGATKASWIREYAERQGISLSESYCYADSVSDLPMLAMVGHPTAVNPEARLRTTALRENWPILDLR